MKRLRRVLAMLLSLALLSTAAISEEALAPAQADEAAQAEARVEEEWIEGAAEESVGETVAMEESDGAEPAAEPSADEPEDEIALPAGPEVVIAPEWEYDAEIGAITIPCAELPETLTFEWNFDGEAAQYAVQTAPVPEGDNPEVRGARIYTDAPRIVLPAADFAEGGWFSLYVTAILADGAEVEGWKYFRLERRADLSERQLNASECDEYGHSWGFDEETGNGTGICEVCGYRCPHEAQYTRADWDYTPGTDAVDYDGANHIAYIDEYNVRFCGECYMDISRECIAQGVGSLQPHDYYDAEQDRELGYCVICGHPRTATQCAHANQLTYIEDEEAPGLRYVSIDNFTHLVTGNMVLITECLDCGEEISRKSATRFEEKHAPEDDGSGNLICCKCQQAVRCDHANRRVALNGANVHSYYENVSGADYHLLHSVGDFWECPDCGYVWSPEDGSLVEQTVQEPHEPSPETGKCVKCEAALEGEGNCKHDGGRTVYYEMGKLSGSQNYDEFRHICYGDEYKVTYCDICFEEIDRVLERENVGRFEAHDFDNGYPHKCKICGYSVYNLPSASCKHEHRESYIEATDAERLDFEYEYVDARTHIVRGDLTIATYCLDCLKDLGTSKATSFVETHSYEGDDVGGKGAPAVCAYCRETIHCDHANSSVFEGGDAWFDYYVNSADPSYHEHHRVGNYWQCDDCGFIWMDEDGIAESVEQEAHIYHYGDRVSQTCLLCGAKATSGSDPDFQIDGNGVLERYYGSKADVVLPEAVKSIGASAFEFNTSIQRVTLPAGLTRIENRAFYKCYNLAEINIPDGVTFIGDDAFYQCSDLTAIDIPGSVKSIGENCFYHCDSLVKLTLGEGVEQIGEAAFSFSGKIDGAAIPRSMKRIGDRAFYACAGMRSLTIAGDDLEIGREAFGGCDALPEVRMLDGVKAIGEEAFSYCDVLRRAEIPDSVTSIGAGAFASCWQLQQVRLPGGLTELPDRIFQNTYSLSRITLPDALRSVGASAFEDSDLVAIHIPASVRTIGDRAFRRCDFLQSLTCEEGLESIGASAFADMDFTEYKNKINIVLPASLTSIGANAFANSPDVLVYVKKNSYAQTFCKNNGIPCRTMNSRKTIEFSGVKDGDFVPQDGYKLRWKKVSGAKEYWIRMGTLDDERMEDARWFEFSKTNSFQISFYEMNWMLPNQEVDVWVGAYSKKGGNYTLLAENSVTLVTQTGMVLPGKVSLSEKKATLGVGQTLRLSAKLSPENASSGVKYSTSNAKIASVTEDGAITALAKGSAKITAETINGKKATCTVTVKKAPTQITLNQSELTLAAMQEAQLKVTLPKNTATGLRWWSSRYEVAYVDDSGSILAVSPGTAQITVTAHNYANGNEALRKTCLVTVLPAPSDLIMPDALTLGKGEKYTLEPRVDEGSQATFTFETSDKKTVSVDSKGKLTAKKTGSAIITVKTHNDLTLPCAVTVLAAPKKLSVSEKKLTLSTGASRTVNVTLPAGTASYKLTPSSNKPKIATVEPVPGKYGEFTIKAISPGKATITIKTYNGKKATVSVTVS